MKKSLFTILVLALMMVLTGCSDDRLLTNDNGSTLEDEGEYKISTFTLSNAVMAAEESVKNITIVLTPEEGTAYEYDAYVDAGRTTMRCRMRIPRNETLPDGEYVLTARYADGGKLGGRFVVVFKNEMLHSVQSEKVEYTKLEGEGTEKSPYIISSKDDFKSLINNLRRDSVAHGSGRYFKQTATFSAPTQSEIYDGRGYYNYAFAGFYDGGGHSIEGLYYVGNNDSKKDCGVGLFAELCDGAEIKNLSLTGVSIMNTSGDCGAFAGTAIGNVKLSNVKVNGTIMQGGYRCGGLVGSLKGTLTVYGYDLNVTISGDTEVGGVLGQAYESSTVNIHSVTTNDHHFTVSGRDNVGGLVGRLHGEFHISRVVLEHTVSSEDKDLRIIKGTGAHTAGVIGRAENVARASSLDSIKIKCPIGGASQGTGGFVGFMKAYAPVTVNYCQMTSVVAGETYVGGLFGYCEMSGSNKIQFIGTDNLTKVVADDAAASVSGKERVGGLFGLLSGNAEFKSKVRIAINVKSTSNDCGGAIGWLSDCTLDLSKLVFDSNSMRVDGAEYCTGGVIGYAQNSTLNGPSSNVFDYKVNSKITMPRPTQFTPTFKGIVTGENYTGGIVGMIYGATIKAVNAECTVTGNGNYTGGIVGYVDFKSSNRIEDCTFGEHGTVTGTNDGTAGIAGFAKKNGTFQDCINYGKITGRHNTGGVVGQIDFSESAPAVNWCVNTGDVTGSGDTTGGVVGCMYGGKPTMQVQYCANYGCITNTGGSGGSALGGVVGFGPAHYVKVLYCANHGKVQSLNAPQHGVGGIAGSLGEDPTIGWTKEDNLEIGFCCNYGEVCSTYSSLNIGGILGYQEEGDNYVQSSYLHDCVNHGPITSSQKDDNGGILGKADNYSALFRCVNFGKVTKGNGTIGTKKSTAVLHYNYLYYLEGSGKSWCSTGSVNESNKSNTKTYSTFDFDNVWIMQDGYPALRKCYFQSIKYFE